MTQADQYDIEHPMQPWWLDGYSEPLDDAHRLAVVERLRDTEFTEEDITLVINSLVNITSFNHLHRQEHESKNLQHLGLRLPSYRRYETEVSEVPQEQQQYEALAGQHDTVGRYVQWFSYITHRAFVAQEQVPANKRFERISLELGGKRQFGDWEATGRLDSMVRNVPHQLLQQEPGANLIIYGGAEREGAYQHPSITYVPEAPKSYTLFPRFEARMDRTHTFRTAMLRRRRPVADIYIAGESDVVLFKESIGLLVIDLIEPGLRKELQEDCERSMELGRAAEHKTIKFQDTDAALIGGMIFEEAIHSPEGETNNVFPVSAHYVQGVGEKYASFRNQLP